MKIAYSLRLFILFFVLFNWTIISIDNNDPNSIKNYINSKFASFNRKSIHNDNALNTCWFTEQETINGGSLYSTIYGDFLVEDPLIIELIKSPEMQRLKKINQYGIDYYVYKPEKYTRFQHSICVYLLTKKYGGSTQEQIAALLHDVSHTAFSHSGDFLLKKDLRGDSYQDDIHYRFLDNSAIKNILKKYNLTTADVCHKNPEFKILDRPVPELCADRIEYNLYGSYIEGILTLTEIKSILNNLKYENDVWYFDDIYSALLISYFALYLTDNRLAGSDNYARNCLFSEILVRALEIKIINLEDIHSSIDEIIWNRLTACNDSIINSKLVKLKNISNYYELDKEQYDVFIYPKFRALNPLIKVENDFFRLTELNQAFNDDFEGLKARISEGFHIKYLN